MRMFRKRLIVLLQHFMEDVLFIELMSFILSNGGNKIIATKNVE